MPLLRAFLAALLFVTPATAESLCPLTGRPAKGDVTVFSEGKQIAVCCKKCQAGYTAARENKLSDAEKKDGWTLVFNGKDVVGFQPPTRTGKWSVAKGILTGTGGPGVIATKETYENFELRFDVRVSDKGERRGNSGVFIRSTGLLAFRGRWPDGIEVQIDHGDKKFWTGAIFKKTPAKKVATKDGEWMQMRIVSQGPDVRVWVNGKLVTEHKEAGPSPRAPLAFQVHHPTDLVEFKNVKVRKLAAK